MILNWTLFIPTHLQAGVIISAEVFVADADETPECLDGRHVHEKESSYRSLGLEVTNFRVQHRVSFENAEELLLPDMKEF